LLLLWSVILSAVTAAVGHSGCCCCCGQSFWLLSLLQSSQTVSLDDFIADEQTTRHEMIADQTQNVAEDFEEQEAKQSMVDALKRLPRRERLIVTLYYYEGATFDEIGRILGVSESRVSQIHSKILHDLRQEMEIKG